MLWPRLDLPRRRRLEAVSATAAISPIIVPVREFLPPSASVCSRTRRRSAGRISVPACDVLGRETFHFAATTAKTAAGGAGTGASMVALSARGWSGRDVGR